MLLKVRGVDHDDFLFPHHEGLVRVLMGMERV